ncbi:MAG: hypothetical protein QXO17_00415 [Nitrososphaerota archaeon]
MCRMVALRFDRGAAGAARALIGALSEASAEDPYLRRLIGDGRHCHGFGYALAGKRGSSWEVSWTRYDVQDGRRDEQEACEANLRELARAVRSLESAIEGYGEVALTLHSRRTLGEPRGTTDAHPFRAELPLSVNGVAEPFELYLSHNGGVDKLPLAEEIGLPAAERMTDSHVLTHYVAWHLRGTDVVDLPARIAELARSIERHVRSSLDLNLLFFGRSTGPLLLAVGYVVSKDENKVRYYEPVLVRGDGISGYVSSTVRDLVEERLKELEFRSFRDRFVAVLGPGFYELLEIGG